MRSGLLVYPKQVGLRCGSRSVLQWRAHCPLRHFVCVWCTSHIHECYNGVLFACGFMTEGRLCREHTDANVGSFCIRVCTLNMCSICKYKYSTIYSIRAMSTCNVQRTLYIAHRVCISRRMPGRAPIDAPKSNRTLQTAGPTILPDNNVSPPPARHTTSMTTTMMMMTMTAKAGARAPHAKARVVRASVRCAHAFVRRRVRHAICVCSEVCLRVAVCACVCVCVRRPMCTQLAALVTPFTLNLSRDELGCAVNAMSELMLTHMCRVACLPATLIVCVCVCAFVKHT